MLTGEHPPRLCGFIGCRAYREEGGIAPLCPGCNRVAESMGAWRAVVHVTGTVHAKRPSFTHEELVAMWHTLSPADGKWQVLASAVAKLDAYMALCRATRGTDGR